jgi:hypothetical protein
MPKVEVNPNLPTNAEVQQYLMLDKLLQSSYIEMKEFSKKKPDEFLNKFKVKSLNRILSPIKHLLKNEPTLSFLDLLDEETIPSYSDSILIIAQFQSAMRQYVSTYFGRTTKFEDSKRWFTKEKPGTHYEWITSEDEIGF